MQKTFHKDPQYSDKAESGKVKQGPPIGLKWWMVEVPSEKELLNAVGKLRSEKADSESGILPDMVKVACCEKEFLNQLMKLVQDI